MTTETVRRPWAALWALLVGFFMILIDSTIVSVANPAIMEGLRTDITSVIWVTSAYLLAFAVPMLVAGRLGDRFGPKRLFILGLAVFTGASVWCGLSGTIGTLIAARAVQGLGAALISPQTMAVITRIFPPAKRGPAMGVWGATAGVAMLVGPLLGGVLVDGLGWEWIFFVNLPVGIAGIVLAWFLVPDLPTHVHHFDWLGVALSAVGVFLVVFGIQEGSRYDWGTITGPVTVWGVIVAGVVVLGGFVVWQAVNRGEPLLPLGLFRNRNFALGNLAITTVGFTITSMPIPLIFFYQVVRGLTPTQSALTLVPMAVVAGVLSPVVGGLANRVNPRYLAVVGMVLMAASLVWYAALLSPDVAIGWVLLPSALMGVSNACVWGPIALATTRDLPPHLAGAGSGVYNVTRQVGSVLGSAAIAALVQSRLTADLPRMPGATGSATDLTGATGTLPEALHAGFTTAMAESLLLPAAAALVGAVVVAFFARPSALHEVEGRAGTESAAASAAARPTE